jgi:hypothetical protein
MCNYSSAFLRECLIGFAQGQIYLYLSNTFIVLGTHPMFVANCKDEKRTRLTKAAIEVDYEESIEVLPRKKTK